MLEGLRIAMESMAGGDGELRQAALVHNLELQVQAYELGARVVDALNSAAELVTTRYDELEEYVDGATTVDWRDVLGVAPKASAIEIVVKGGEHVIAKGAGNVPVAGPLLAAAIELGREYRDRLEELRQRGRRQLDDKMIDFAERVSELNGQAQRDLDVIDEVTQELLEPLSP